MLIKTAQHYNVHAKELSAQYQAVSSEFLHRRWVADSLPATPGFACDIGAGSGRDANWLAEKGWDVIAVDPSRGMRELAIPKSHSNVTWLDAFRILTELLKPGGTLVITLRHGSDEHENRDRGFHPVSAAELAVFAQRRAVVMRDPVTQPDQTRTHVQWETVAFST